MEILTPQKGYCEGDTSPGLKKRIHTLIIKTKDYVVYLDDDFYVEWEEFDTNDYSDNYSEVMNRVAYLETISTTHFPEIKSSGGIELFEFRRLLGEAVARVYDGDGDSADSVLDKAEQLLFDRSIQRARQWYLSAAAVAALFPMVFLITLWLFRLYFRSVLGLQAFDVAICACLGGIGALISTIIRVRKVTLNSSSGPLLHFIEGTARIIVGIIGGALVTLAIKCNIFLGIINNTNMAVNFSFLACIALISGASEQVVPNLIAQIETKANSDTDNEKG